MIELLTALQAKFNADATLLGTFPDGVYLSSGPDGRAVTAGHPMAVLVVVSGVPEYTTGKTSLNRVTVQFSVFAATDTEALHGLEAVKKCFDFCTLTLASQQSVLVQRRNENILMDDERVWHAFTEYQVWVGETLP